MTTSIAWPRQLTEAVQNRTIDARSSDAWQRAITAGDKYWTDETSIARVQTFFRKWLKHTKGEHAGEPLILQEWADRDILRPIFGEKRTADGYRRYRTAYIEVPRKNAKSTIAAGIALYLLFADGEPGAEIYSAAADRGQARIVFEDATTMVVESGLKPMSRVFKSVITNPDLNAKYQVISKDSNTKHGFNSHGVVFDELHTQPNRDLWDVLTTSTGSRRQPLVFTMTTAGVDKLSICYEQHDYAVRILRGELVDDSFLPVIYSAVDPLDTDPNAVDKVDWRSVEAMERANPGLGVTVYREYLEHELEQAIQIPGRQNTYKRLHLNLWTEQASRWLDVATWDDADPQTALADLADRWCVAGLDLASTTDIAALVLFFPDADKPPTRIDGMNLDAIDDIDQDVEENEEVEVVIPMRERGGDVLSFFFAPEDNIRLRVTRDKVPYDLWAEQGFLELTEGNVVDYDRIRTFIRELSEIYEIREIAIDRWNSTQLQTQLAGDGFEVVQFGQGFASMTAPSKELERLMLSHKLRHGDNPILRWMIANVAAETDSAGNIKPSKKVSTERIDGVVSLIMAIGRVLVFDEEVSVYETRGLIDLDNLEDEDE